MDPAVDNNEVIELTTDDESAYTPSNPCLSVLALKIKRLNMKRETLKAIEAELAKQDVRLQQERQCAGQIKRNIDENLVCTMCNDIMFDPYILQECGHTYCCQCLVTWFYFQKRGFIPNNIEEENREEVLHALIIILRRMLPDLTPKGLSITLDPSRFAKPIFTCPTCRTAVPIRPTKNTALESIAIALHGPRPQERPVVPHPWNELFPCILDAPSSTT